jgi:hypothetical protein
MRWNNAYMELATLKAAEILVERQCPEEIKCRVAVCPSVSRNAEFDGGQSAYLNHMTRSVSSLPADLSDSLTTILSTYF